MEAISRYFQGNLDVVYFFYGTAFVVMGVAILLHPKRSGSFPLAASLSLLGWFGLIHGVNEYLDMWTLIKRPESAAFGLAKFFVLIISYLFLFEFGRRSLRAGLDGASPRLAKIARLLGWQVLPVLMVLTVGLAAASSDFLKNAFSLSRYLIGFPGAMLAGAAVITYSRAKAAELDVLNVRNYFILAGAGFAAYGVTSGLIPAAGNYFPANLLNAENFMAVTGFPVQLIRAACAAVISWGIIGALRVFNREKDELLQGVVFNNSQDCIADIGLDGSFQAVNKACLQAHFHGASVIRENAPGFSSAVSRAAEGGVSSVQYNSYDRKGREIWWDAVVSPVMGLDEKISGVLCVARDITGRRRDLENLRRNHEAQSIANEILSLAVESVSLEDILGRVLDRILAVPWLTLQKKGAILLTDPAGMNLAVKAQRGLSITVPTGRPCALTPASHCLCGEVALNGETVFVEEPGKRQKPGHTGRKPQGHYCLPIKFRNRMQGVLALYAPGGYTEEEGARDFLATICAAIAKIVEYNELETKVYRMQKLEALGRTAGAIAHDFNNILTSMKGFSSLAQEALEEGSEARKYLKELASGIDKGAGLVQQILAFSRSQPAEMSAQNLNAVITGMEKILNVVLEKKARLKLNLAPGLPEILGNKNQLEQIIMNLAVNARDAMPKGGEFTIVTRPAAEACERCAPGLSPAPRAVELALSDTGGGIPEEVKDRIFEPFFTTKPEGKGTGLGLSTVYSLVKLHKGEISVDSQVGRGTTFDIRLPSAGAQVKLETRDAAEIFAKV